MTAWYCALWQAGYLAGVVFKRIDSIAAVFAECVSPACPDPLKDYCGASFPFHPQV